MSATQGRGYQRSWKNLLINKEYQLRFTLVMVALSAVLMTGLGIWVMSVARDTTEVTISGLRGNACPSIEQPVAPAPVTAVPAQSVTPGGTSESGRRVQIEESTMTVAPEAQAADAISIAALAAGYGNQVAAYWTCQARQAAEIATKRAGQSTILLVLIVSSVLLAFGLGVYGILMTHKVAGPLFKVSLYLEKMKNGRLDKVYNLRKGDQLVEFYEHFKTGHAGMVALQQGDIAALKAAQDTISATAGSVGDRLQSLITKKEKSLE
jgi:hypothetical protein